MTATTIQELFEKPVDRPIDGVIKADDIRNLKIELDEYVITREVAKGLNVFSEAYLHNPTANGVWISGFFGSGKSHLLKMLSLMLDSEKQVEDQRPADILLPKVDDEILRADLKKATAIPSRSLLFNIDQKYDGIGGTHEAPVLEVFMKVLNELQGYYGNQGYVAQLEHDMATRGEFEPFQQTYAQVNNRQWSDDRDAVATVTKRKFAKAYAEHFGGSEDDAITVINDAKKNYRLSIEGFAKRVREYLDQQEDGFRLNFFVDEAGQFIGQERSRLLNLQTVVESLATATDGRATVFITSQADLEGVLGQVKIEQADDLSKIQGRFKTKLSLASADVQEVIQRRLLAKKPNEPEQLIEIYEQEQENFKTLFRFSEDSRQLKGWNDCQSFCGLYPFHPYQLALFQEAIQSLASHSIFEGRSQSVGERSMLAVFQDVAKTIKELPVGRLASFDQLYDGIEGVIRADKKQTMATAQNQVTDLELRILKALFLIKWVPQFKSTPRNIAILLINQPNFDIRIHEQGIKDALINLERQSYLQRNGEVYEFLTDKEKDVEQEIKREEVGDSQVLKQLNAIVFDDVLGATGKVRFEDNNNDYPISHKIDDGLVSRKDADISINLITPEHENYGNEPVLIGRNMGGVELMAILPDQDSLLSQLRSFLKTDLYIKKNSGSDDELLESILAARARQNTERRSALEGIVKEQLRTAQLILNGQTLSVGEGEPKARFSKAYQKLIRSAYPNLKMIRGVFNEGSITKVIGDQDDLLEGSAIQLSEAEDEVLTEVFRNQNSGERLSAESLVRRFERRPYGWSQWATLTFIARLHRLSKLELREKQLLSDREVIESLCNSRRLGDVTIRKQEAYDPSQINALKQFHRELFGKESSGTEARSTCEAFRCAMKDELQDLNTMAAQAEIYPFLDAVKPWAKKAKAMAEKENSYLLTQLDDFKEDWLDAEEETLTPLKLFLNGNQKRVYDGVKAFAARYSDEFSSLPAEQLQPITELLASSTPYAGGLIPKANNAQTALEQQLQERLQQAREAAEASLTQQENQLKAGKDFQALTSEQQGQVLQACAAAKADLQSATKPSAVTLRLNRYRDTDKPKQLATIARFKAPPTLPGGTDKPAIKWVPASSLTPNCNLSEITNSADLEQWLSALKQAAEAELNQGHRISL
ncbi:BREX system P-loop protein BrxC [Synechococcus sp. BMK-MC-1]|uniref:BREX system P-loop protein BrxC n=1 Tax=Synechococcus sp. BMK-MC-1 TaxID=1442551 RepID=UPI0016473883|nr:BREX system P-loop protein BrxC [Synechococcus sp. BMK-MC-1]QNI68446.1 hypothetical protein SynBMKMC1_02390 [Synechococcus sp. BMK-MC-1]